MNREILFWYLAAAEQHIEHGERNISDQELRIEGLDRRGQDQLSSRKTHRLR